MDSRATDEVTASERSFVAERRHHFNPYPAYKDSGVDWLGEIPAHWEVKPIRALARPGYKTFTDGDWIESPFIRDEGIRLIQTGNIGVGEYEEQGFRYIDEETFRAFRCTEVLPGEVLICRLADPVGRACLAPDLRCRMITSVDVCILKAARDVHAAFVVYALTGSEYLAWLGGICRGGTRDRVSRSMLGAIRVQSPPLSEQRAIAAFLDRETARIDALVAKKKRLIELLQEKRSALITRAVTTGLPTAAAAQAGLDPDVPMKDSGVEWLGDIPAHWEVRKLKALSSLQTGITLGKHYESKGLAVRPYLRVANVQDGYLDLDDIAEIGMPRNEVQRYQLERGDVLLTEGGDFDKLGRGYVWEDQIPGCLHQNHIFAVRPVLSELNPHFLATVMSSEYGRAYFTATSKQSTNLASTNSTKLRNFPTPVPPRTEQEEILGFLAGETGRLHRMEERIGDAIDRLKELRSALISAAVTGKIDAREEVG